MKRTTALLLLLVILLTGCARKVSRLDDAPGNAPGNVSGDGSKAEATENDDAESREEIPPPDYDELPPWLREALNDYFYPENPEDRLDEVTTVEFFRLLTFYTVDLDTEIKTRRLLIPCIGFNESRVSIVPSPGRLILSERMNTYLETIDDEWRLNRLQSLFVYKDPFAPELTKNKKREMLEAYPECLRGGAVYELPPETSTLERNEVRDILVICCEDIMRNLSLSDPGSTVDFTTLRIFPNLISVTVNEYISTDYILSNYVQKAAEVKRRDLSSEDQAAVVQKLGQYYDLSPEEQASAYGDLYNFSTVPDNVALFFRFGSDLPIDAPDPVELNPASIPSKAETDALWINRAMELLP